MIVYEIVGNERFVFIEIITYSVDDSSFMLLFHSRA